MTTRYFKGHKELHGCEWKIEGRQVAFQFRAGGWRESSVTLEELLEGSDITETTAEGEPLKQD